jgi:hypothetical protein
MHFLDVLVERPDTALALHPSRHGGTALENLRRISSDARAVPAAFFRARL